MPEGREQPLVSPAISLFPVGYSNPGCRSTPDPSLQPYRCQDPACSPSAAHRQRGVKDRGAVLCAQAPPACRRCVLTLSMSLSVYVCLRFHDASA